jgi:fused signal recognition particle receptor
MFKNLKDKLKGWIKKTDEETVEKATKDEEKITKKISKKTQSTKKKEQEKSSRKKKDSKNKKKDSNSNLSIKVEKTKAKSSSNANTKDIEKEEEPSESKKESKKKFSLFNKKKESIEEEIKETEEELEEVEEELDNLKSETIPTIGDPEVLEKPKKYTNWLRKTLTKDKFEELFEELEMILLQNNVAYEAVESMKKSLEKKLVGESAKIDIIGALKESIEELLQNPPNIINQIKEKKDEPFVILFAGINGSGKTTTIAKLANLFKKNKLSVCLASADTFRAAAIEQLQIHADKLEIPLIKKDYGSDPASVGFDAVKYAKKNNIDVVLIDTAGRMNNRDSLMKEIEKIARVNSPDLKIFLGESITGNDATTQAKDFNDAIGIDGIILSKADVDEKGGTAISVSHVTGKPIYFLGTGQTYDELEAFDKKNLVKRIMP